MALIFSGCKKKDIDIAVGDAWVITQKDKKAKPPTYSVLDIKDNKVVYKRDDAVNFTDTFVAPINVFKKDMRDFGTRINK